jgi:YVTN family beta-propeller protein
MYSSPIAVTQDKLYVWVVSPDDDSVYVINASTNTLVSRIFVGDEPQSIALDPNNGYAYVANAADNTVSVIQITGGGASGIVQRTFITGAEPWNIVISPDGNRVYVANSVQDTLTVISATATFPVLPRIIGNVTINNSACNNADPDRHFQPRGLAIDGTSKKLYVTRFLSFVKAGGRQATDGGKEGLVCRMDINTTTGTIGASVTNFVSVTLPATDTGFKDQNGNATSAYPNQMQSIVLRGTRAFMPNIAASPSGPLKFNVDTEAYVSMIDPITGTMASAGSLNLHLGARVPEAGKTKLFFANAWALAFTTQSGAGSAYVVSAASDLVVKLNVDASNNITFTNGVSTTRYIDLNDPTNPTTSGRNAGKNPLGIAVFSPGNIGNPKAYVMNYVSRNVSVIDTSTDAVTAVINLATLPTAGTQEEQLLVGAEIFFSSRGNFTTTTGVAVAPGTSLVNRLSSEGWQACASCHFNGWTDGEVWAFGAGPRKSVPLNGTWSPHNPSDQRILNYSAIFDEVQDFEANIRNVSGPGGTPPVLNQGLIISDTGTADAPPAVVNAFNKANAGRPQLAVLLSGSSTRWPALDAVKEWVRFAIRTPNGALTVGEVSSTSRPNVTPGNTTGALTDSFVVDGRRLFFQAGCVNCHGGTKWTLSTKDFTSPPATANVFTEAGTNFIAGTNPLTTVQFYSSTTNPLRNVGSFNLNVTTTTQIPGGSPLGLIGGVEKAQNGLDALGRDYNGDGNGNGYNIPSLLGIWNLPPYYHNGACETLMCVLKDVTHRTKGLAVGQSDPLTATNAITKVLTFLKTLDADTDFPTTLRIDPTLSFGTGGSHDIFLDPPTVFTGTQLVIGANIGLFGTKTDLANIIADLGITSTFLVKFQVVLIGPGNPGPLTQTFQIKAADFNHNFGFATYSMTVNVPTQGVQQGVVGVTIDPNHVFPSDVSISGFGIGSRSFPILNRPRDTTPPVVNATFLSDEVVFNDNDAIATTRNVKVKIVASDPISVVSGFTTTTGVQSYCVVHYYYDRITRRWVPTTCGTGNSNFTPLPPAEPGGNNISGTFIVNTTIGTIPGTAYAFAWVKDGAGNISRVPGFDVISYLPAGNLDILRNDTRLFRILMPPGQALTMTFPVVFGDVDVTLFDGVLPTSQRIFVSANIGAITETVPITSSNSQIGNKLFQVEVKAFVSSRFRITTLQASCPSCRIEEVDAATGEPTPTSAEAVTVGEPQRDGAAEPMVAGPPALQTAIGGDFQVFLPLVIR